MTRALLVVDAQQSFPRRELWRASSNPDVADDIASLVDHFRARGDHVVWVLHTEPGSGTVFDPDRGFVQPLAGLSAGGDEPVLTKTVHNPFTGTTLHDQLGRWEVSEVTVCGIRTEQCCETTARIASDLGYRVTFPIDATATEPIEAPGSPTGRSLDEILADPLTLGTDEVVQRTAYALAGRFADVCTLEDLLSRA
ncbi:isochorismatase family protein [Spiractinospora alimapuensis]|uniref:isochorismatase family protein n=1 Tax=Spiractinospora alimapuensis TaxID=2820884 RepID=UPI001F4523B1|nr:isochorismatase family protein [Spiractinospora alimapuensis]QVQ50877.1 isochorismatase family protein [Spiractinospora alimapuensis]